jgi:ribonuclease P protein component
MIMKNGNQTSSNASSSDGRQRYRLGADQRIKKTAQFRQIYGKRRSCSDSLMVVYCHANNLKHCRVGVSVSKKCGPAVKRNFYKRRLREAFRLSQHDLPTGYDYILIPRREITASTESYRKSLIGLCRTLSHRDR